MILYIVLAIPLFVLFAYLTRTEYPKIKGHYSQDREFALQPF